MITVPKSEDCSSHFAEEKTDIQSGSQAHKVRHGGAVRSRFSHLSGGQGGTRGARPIPSSQVSMGGLGPAETGAQRESSLLGCDGPVGGKPGPGRSGLCLGQDSGQAQGSGPSLGAAAGVSRDILREA